MAKQQYDSLLKDLSNRQQTLEAKLQQDQLTNDVAAVKRDFVQRIELGKDGENGLRAITFPSWMVPDVDKYISAIHVVRSGAEAYVKSNDDAAREQAVAKINQSQRIELNAINQVRADLGLPELRCP